MPWISSSISIALNALYMLTMLKSTCLIKTLLLSFRSKYSTVSLTPALEHLNCPCPRRTLHYTNTPPNSTPSPTYFSSLEINIYSISQALSLVSSSIPPLYTYLKSNSLIFLTLPLEHLANPPHLFLFVLPPSGAKAPALSTIFRVSVTFIAAPQCEGAELDLHCTIVQACLTEFNLK